MRGIDNMKYKFYAIADLHFNHKNIIEYCDRPFSTVEQMNDYMIEQWNNTVSISDTIYLLGDVGFGNANELSQLINQLNGNKILIMGNHDRRISKSHNKWLEMGFDCVRKNPIQIKNYILSHEPQEILHDSINVNIHAHIHNTTLNSKFNKDNHICVSVEVVDYKPRLFEI